MGCKGKIYDNLDRHQMVFLFLAFHMIKSDVDAISWMCGLFPPDSCNEAKNHGQVGQRQGSENPKLAGPILLILIQVPIFDGLFEKWISSAQL